MYSRKKCAEILLSGTHDSMRYYQKCRKRKEKSSVLDGNFLALRLSLFYDIPRGGFNNRSILIVPPLYRGDGADFLQEGTV